MTEKQREIQKMLPLISGKEVKVWLTGQMDGKNSKQTEPFIEGTVDPIPGQTTYLTLRNAILYNGKFFNDYDISIGTIGKIIQK